MGGEISDAIFNGSIAMTDFNQTEIQPIFDVAKLITLFQAQLPPSGSYEQELYDFWVLIHMEEGERTIRIGDMQHCLLSGQVMLYPPDIPHQFVENADKACKVGIVSFICLSPVMSFFQNKVFTLRAKEKNLLTGIFAGGGPLFKWFEPECIQKGMYATKDTRPEQLYRLKLSLETFLTALYTEYPTAVRIPGYETARKKNQNKNAVRLVLEYMEHNLKNNPTVEKIANECGLGVSSLKRIFKEETGRGVIDYFNDIKIMKAAGLIQDSVLNISQIAEQVGFSSPFYFSRIFKQRLGVSPMEYSKSARR